MTDARGRGKPGASGGIQGVRTVAAPTDRRLQRLAIKADRLADRRDLPGAVRVWRKGLERIVEVGEFASAPGFHARLGDALFRLGDHRGALEHMNAVLMLGVLDDAHVWMRLGQAALELGDEAGAGDGLMSGFLLEGPGLFADEDPKYLRFLASRVDL